MASSQSLCKDDLLIAFLRKRGDVFFAQRFVEKIDTRVIHPPFSWLHRRSRRPTGAVNPQGFATDRKVSKVLIDASLTRAE